MATSNLVKCLRLAVSITLLLVLIGSQQAAASTQSDFESIFKHTPNYDPNACGGTSQPAATPTTSTGNSVYIVGDSVLVGAYYTPPNYLKQDLTTAGWSPSADASGGRGMSYPGTDPRGGLPGQNKSGLDAIKADQDTIKSANAVVIELGTNETDPPAGASKSSALFKAEVEQAITDVKNINNLAQIYWVNLFSNATQPYTPWVQQYNQVISSVASAKNINVIDTTSSGISLSSDGIHPDTGGYKTLSQVITSAIGQPGSPNDTGTTSCCQSGGSSLGPGSLPSYIKEPYNSIFTAAAKKYNVDPAVLVALFYDEQYGYPNAVASFNSHVMPDPPPPYGHGAPWNNGGGAGAQGPFQFIASTWAAGGVDGNGDGKKDPNDLTDAAFAAAKGLNDGLFGGVKLTTSSNKLEVIKAASYYYGAGAGIPNAYGFAAGTIFAKVQADEGGGSVAGGPPTASVGSDCSGSAVSPGNYQNPFKDVHNIAQAGIDAGVDYSGDGPVHPIGDGTITYISGSSGWVGGNAVSYKVTGGTANGKIIYVAENCSVNTQLHVGDPVHADTTICTMHNSYPYIETGWIHDADIPMAYADNCYYLVNPSIPNKTSTAYGVNFDSLMHALGAPKASLLAPPVTCKLPSGWPTQW